MSLQSRTILPPPMPKDESEAYHVPSAPIKTVRIGTISVWKQWAIDIAFYSVFAVFTILIGTLFYFGF